MRRGLKYAVVFALLLVALAPMFSVIWASWFAKRHGCNVNEGSSTPCIVDGVDWGDTLYTAFVSGWFMLVTLPFAAIVALLLLWMILHDLFRSTKKSG